MATKSHWVEANQRSVPVAPSPAKITAKTEAAIKTRAHQQFLPWQLQNIILTHRLSNLRLGISEVFVKSDFSH